LLGLPELGSDADLSEAIAKQVGFNRPTNDLTIRLLSGLVDCLRKALISRPDYPIDKAEAANSVLGCMFLGIPAETIKFLADDVGDDQWTGTLQTFVAVEVVPKLGRAGLIDLHPPADDA
jgi:hypothetical protein